ncbi:hypothetical protein PspLS_11539 [Pyricularia sp. CBS 133598]|nr:hypothetical protein PspLS_11539 [Pyricularia sp. CBS 133598]
MWNEKSRSDNVDLEENKPAADRDFENNVEDRSKVAEQALPQNSNNEGDDSDAESVGGQRSTMTTRQLLLAFPALSISLFVSFIDQTSVSTAIPAIAEDLDTGAATSWIGASFLIASTAFQLINGRLSDIFGRKNLLLVCLGLMGLGDLLCGFAKTKEQLFAFRAIAGVGGGGINSIVMIIVSDITTLENRGKYQGVLGAMISLANGVGPFLGGVVVEKANWRWVFWMVPLLAAPTAAVIFFFLTLRRHDGSTYFEKIKRIDHGGIVLNLASVLLVLIPLSGGGVTYAWASPFLVGTLVAGCVLAVGFVLYEWKVAEMPIMPLRLYRYPHCAYLYVQTFLTGLAYFGAFFYLPIYFQSVLGNGPLVSGVLLLSLVITSSFSSILSGFFMARKGRYMPCILVGFALWTLGNGLTLMFDRSTVVGALVAILIVQGFGTGLTLQPTLVGMYANSASRDRAVTTGLRNFIRTIGGAFGLVISGAILNNTLKQDLSGRPGFSEDIIASLTSSAYTIDALGLPREDVDLVLTVYMRGLHYIFIFFTVCSALSLLLTFGVGNTDLKAKSKTQADGGEKLEQQAETTPTSTPASRSGSSLKQSRR